MIKLSVCIGTDCHLRGSRDIIERLQKLICEKNLKDEVDMSGKFCLGRCQYEGVSVSVNEKDFSLTLDEVDEFFEREIVQKLQNA
ncbi:MAG: (2Fe-2S) ferredoxin domain-containing protein [Clostridia bacterium]